MKPLGNWYKIGHRILLEKSQTPAHSSIPEGLQWLSANDHLPNPWVQCVVPQSYQHLRAKILIRNLPESMIGFRILHLADLHFTARWGKAHDQLIARLADDPPDLILFTGDFVEDRCDHRAGMINVLKFCSRLKSKNGIYAILGNHDPDVMTPYLIESGIGLITETQQVVNTGRGAIELIGFPGQARLDMDPLFIAGLPMREVGTPRIIVSHYPDLIGAGLKLDADLYLCGHTHGGQICLPGQKPLLTHDSLPKKFATGLHRIGDTWINISNGFGFTGISLRIFCPSAVTEFVLSCAGV